MNELFLTVDRNSKDPLYVQIYHYIKNEIVEGRLTPGTSLPSIRKLSQQLSVNKMTLESAYDQLVIEGLIESRPRSGYYINKIDLGYFRRPANNERKTILKDRKHSYKYDFALDHIDVDHFPTSTWRKLTTDVLTNHFDEIANTGDPQGDINLRQQIADYVRYSRGVNCTEEQVVIGPNSQIMLSLICRLIGINNGGKVALGEPGYSLATYMFKALGCTIKTISMEKDGLNQKELVESGASLVFTSPSSQFPFGNMMTIQKRIQLLEWASSTNAYIVEDDYLSEYRYYGQLIPSLQSLDRDERVIYMGTFHGGLLPAINIGYFILPSHLVSEYYKNYYDIQQTTSQIEQRVLSLFIKNGHWEKHRFRMREIYRLKYEKIVNSIEEHFKEKAIVWKGQTGLHIVIQIVSNESEAKLLQMAKNGGVSIYSYSETWYRKENNSIQIPTFMLGFGGLSLDEIDMGIKLLYTIWFNNSD